MDHPFNADLRAVLDADEAYNFLPVGTWMSGGCGLLAESLHRLISGSEVCVIGRLDAGIPDHMVLRLDYGDHIIYVDYNGVQSESELLHAIRSECQGVPVQICSLNEAINVRLDLSDVLWQRDLVAPFCRYLQRELGQVDAERCDPMWADESESVLNGPSL